MEYEELCLESTEQMADDVEAWLTEKELSFARNDKTTLQPPPVGMVRFFMYISPSDCEEIMTSLKEDGFDKITISTRRRNEEEWKDVWKQFFHTRLLGRFAIVPSWEEAGYTPKQGEIQIRLDPGRAFGTGGHESTRLCLLLLDQIDVNFHSVLDVGCGCGTLAIAALLCQKTASAIAIDIDPEALEVTRENIARNQINDRVQVLPTLISDLLGTYDLVFANLTGPTLIEFVRPIANRVDHQGILILAGILCQEGDQVLNAYKALGFHVEKSLVEGEWIAYQLRKQI